MRRRQALSTLVRFVVLCLFCEAEASGSIKHEIGHLCHDERRPSKSDKQPSAGPSMSQPPSQHQQQPQLVMPRTCTSYSLLSLCGFFSSSIAMERVASVTCQGQTYHSAGISLTLPLRIYLGSSGRSQGVSGTSHPLISPAAFTIYVVTAVMLLHRWQYNPGRCADDRKANPTVVLTEKPVKGVHETSSDHNCSCSTVFPKTKDLRQYNVRRSRLLFAVLIPLVRWLMYMYP